MWIYEFHDANLHHRKLVIGLCADVSERQACEKLWKELERLKRPPVPTLSDFIDDTWLPPRLRRWASANTKKVMVSRVNSLIAPDPIAKIPMDLIGKKHVEDYFARLQDRGISKSTGQCVIGILRNVFEEAIDHDLIGRNPARRVQLPRLKELVETRPFSIAEVRRLVLVPGVDGLMMRVLLYGGLRIGELMALRRSDVLPGGLLVDEGLVEGAHTRTKTGNVEPVALPPGLLQDLATHLAATDGGPEDPLFVRDGVVGWRDGDALNDHLKVCAELVEVEGFTSRRCRTTTATLLKAADVDVALHLRHAGPMTTRRHYIKAVDERLRAAVDGLEEEAQATVAPVVKRKRRAG